MKITVWVQKFHDRDNLVMQWTDPRTGLRKSKTAATADRSAAETAAKDLEYELRHGLHSEPSKMPWAEFVKIYMAEKMTASRAGTQVKAAQVLRDFYNASKPKSVNLVDERMLSRYAMSLRSGGLREATIYSQLAYLRAALRWATNQGFMERCPKFTMPKLPKKSHIRNVSADEFAKLMAAAESDAWRVYLAVAWYSGMRRSEILDLVWDQRAAAAPWIDFTKSRIMIPAACCKANADQWIPLAPKLADILGPIRQASGRIFDLGSPGMVTLRFAQLADRAGVDCTLHDLRRSFGSRYAPHVSAVVLQRLMRHASIQTTLAFYTDVDGVLDEAIRKA